MWSQYSSGSKSELTNHSRYECEGIQLDKLWSMSQAVSSLRLYKYLHLSLFNKLSSTHHTRHCNRQIDEHHLTTFTIMHFLLLGATGRTGQHVVSYLLASGHTATALVRDASKFTARSGLTIVVGSPLSKEDIRKAYTASLQPPSAAIFTLNTVRASDSPFAAQVSPPRFLADSCANVCKVLEQQGCQRVVIMSTAGVGDSWNNLSWLGRAFMGWTNVRYALEDHNLLDVEVRKTNMNWTLIRPVKLRYEGPDSDTNPKLRVLGSDGRGMKLSDSAGNAAVARLLIQTAVEGLYIREAVVVVN